LPELPGGLPQCLQRLIRAKAHVWRALRVSQLPHQTLQRSAVVGRIALLGGFEPLLALAVIAALQAQQLRDDVIGVGARGG